MRIAIYSDVHGNLEALDAVLEALSNESVDRTICLGDLVGYGPNPNECIEKVMESADVVVAGNHDYAAVNLVSTDHFNEYARVAIDWTKKVLSPNSVNILNGLPLVQCDESYTVVHATPEAPDQWHYLYGESEAYNNLMSMTTSLCFVGHSHMPLGFMMDQTGNLYFQQDLTDTVIETDKKYIINVGSVGQPRDGDPRACLGYLDTKDGKFQLKRISYTIEVTQEKMRKNGLPAFLIERLSWGR